MSKMEDKLDNLDKKILQILQRDADTTISEISEQAGISQTPCWKRIKRLEEKGIIERRVALLNSQAINLPVTGYIQVRTSHHNDTWLKKFTTGIRNIPEVVECHRMTGNIDYLLKIVAPDMAGYDKIYKRIIRIADITDMSASFSMECVKQTTQLPLDYA